MKRVVFALLLVSIATPAAADRQLEAAFHAAFGKSGSALLKKQGQLKEDVKYTPGDVYDAPFGPVLLSPGEVVDGAHANSGKLAIVYLKPGDKGLEVAKKFVPAAEIGAFGKIVDFSVSKYFGGLPVVTVNGADNWQGYACSSAALLELTPDGPRHLVTIPMTYDNSGAAAAGKKLTQINGRIDNIQPGKSFDVVYFGSGKESTDRYVRKGDAYVLASGQSRVQRC
jgi:hypothetical protein